MYVGDTANESRMMSELSSRGLPTGMQPNKLSGRCWDASGSRSAGVTPNSRPVPPPGPKREPQADLP